MTKEEKLRSMLQPKDYVSKIKLYCKETTFKIEKRKSICEVKKGL